jgi:hypothetical protein
MYDLERFGRLLRRDFSPLVYAQGFEASGGVFRRVKDERIDIVSLQGSRTGRRCCVDLGVHYSFLPPSGRADSAEADHGRLKLRDCAFRGRLRGAGESDHWWSYGSDDSTAEANAASLIDTYRCYAHLFFARFEPFPEVFAEVTPAHLETGGLVVAPVSHTPAHAALTMARIMKQAGLADRCREFAEAGLRHLGSATRLAPEFEQLKNLG